MNNYFYSELERFLDTDTVDRGQLLATAKFLINTLSKALNTHQIGIWSFDSAKRSSLKATLVSTIHSPNQDSYSKIKQNAYFEFFHQLKTANYTLELTSDAFAKLGIYAADFLLPHRTQTLLIAPIKLKGQVVAIIQAERMPIQPFSELEHAYIQQATSIYGRCLANAHKQAEFEKLKSTAPTTQIKNHQLRAIHQGMNLSSLITATDTAGYIADINDSYLELTGYSRCEIIGQPQSIFKSHLHAPEYYQIMWRLLKQGNTWKGRLCNKKKNGDLFWLQATITPVLNDNKQITGYVGFYHDISQEVATEQQLKHSERLASLGSFRIEESQTFWQCSDELHRFLNTPTNSLVSQKHFEAFIHPEHRTLFRFNFQSLLRDKTQITLKLRINSHDEKWIRLNAKKADACIIGSIQDITEAYLKDQTLHRTISLQNAIFDAASLAVIATNIDGTITHFNRTAEQLLSYKAVELIGIETPVIFHDPKELCDRLSSTDSTCINFKDLVNASDDAKSIDQEWVYISKNGRQIPVELTYSAIKNTYQQITGYLAVVKDISQQKQAEKTSSNLATILATAGDLAHFGGFEYLIEEDNLQITHLDLQKQLCPINQKVALNEITLLIHPNDKDLFQDAFSKAIEYGIPFDIQVKIRGLNRGYDWIRIAGTAQANGPSHTILGFIHTINEQKMLEQKLSSLALTDELTGISNRRSLIQTMTSEWNRHQRYQTPSSILLIDIDLFKKVNDQWGHDVGDYLLVEFSRRINEQLRTSDTFGRLGGEEFLVVVSNNSENEAYELAEKLRLYIANKAFTYQGLGISQPLNIDVSISIGVCGLNSSIQSQDQWLIEADKALYEAKTTGRNKVSLANCTTKGELMNQTSLKMG